MIKIRFFIAMMGILPFLGGCGAIWESVAQPLVQVTLNLNFLSDQYALNGNSYSGISNFAVSPLVSFSRNSTGTYFDSNGTLQTAAANVPRLDHNPTNYAALGMLIEQSATNNYLDSSNFTLAWTLSSAITVTPNSMTAPDGTMTGSLISANGSALSYIGQSPFATANLTVTRSVFAKAGTTGVVIFEFLDPRCGANCRANFNVNTQTGVWNAVQTGEGPLVIEALNNGWYRLGATYSYSAAGSPSQSIYIAAYGAGVGTAYLWGAQTEVSPVMTSYIPTAAATVTRSADQFSVGTVSGWFNLFAGTLYGKFVALEAVETAQEYVADFSDGTSNNQIAMYLDGAGNLVDNVITSGSPIYASSLGTLSANQVASSAISYNANNFYGGLSGVAMAPVTTGTVPLVSSLQLGSSAGGSNSLNGWLQNIIYYNGQLSSSQVQHLSATGN